MALECAQVSVLAGRARTHRPFSQVYLLEARGYGGWIEIEQRALRDRDADRALDIPLRKIVAALELLIEVLQHATRLLAGFARSFDRDLIAA